MIGNACDDAIQLKKEIVVEVMTVQMLVVGTQDMFPIL